MDCLRVTETLSALRDGEIVSAEEIGAAHVHCATCAGCATFAATLKRLDALPAPHAPEALVGRIIARAATEARVLREMAAENAAALASAAPAVGGAPVADAPRQRGVLSRLRGSSYFRPASLAAAAVVVLAAGLTAVTLMRPGAATAPDESASLTGPADGDTFGAMADSAAPEAALSAERASSDATAAAPDYVSFDGSVYILDGPAVDASALTTVGVVATSLGEDEAPVERHAYLSAQDRDALLVKLPDGTYLRFSPVVRTHGQVRFVLQTGAAITAFGMWPTLPDGFIVPAGPDGSPSFQLFGHDDMGVAIYSLTTGRITTGFAIAPGTAPDDPAAGNPGWTWWAPAD